MFLFLFSSTEMIILSCIILDKKYAAFLACVALHVLCLLSLAAFKIFSSSLVLNNLIMMWFLLYFCA